MTNEEPYSRTISLFNNYCTYINDIDKDNIEANITIEKLITLKSILSNINNTLTLLATRAIASKLSEVLCMNDKDRDALFKYIDNRKPNANGFDIQIDSPSKILVEVKCNSLIRDKKFGTAQINSILEDARKLRLESERSQKAHDKIHDTKDYIKIIAIVNFGYKTDSELIHIITHETTCRETTNTARKNRMKVKTFMKHLSSLSQLKEITELENVYLTVLSKKDLDDELKKIKNIH